MHRLDPFVRIGRFLVAAGLCLTSACAMATENTRPNILWISCEDISPHLGCYGDPHAITPHLDQLASEGVRYRHAFTTAGVCAPCRSGIITGMYQTTLGTQHMRCRAQLPAAIKTFPTYLRESGYFCTNQSKQDYQFVTPEGTWDASSGSAHWRDRPDADQPFFSVFNFTGCHESGIARDEKYATVTEHLTRSERQDADALTTLPPYYPDNAVAREDWKRNYELITAMDHWAGELIRQLKEDGLYEKTIIFFWSDHGVGLPRAKRWLYDSGTHIPLIVRIPESLRKQPGGGPGTVSDRLVSSIDFAPTVLRLAGIEPPSIMQGQSFLDPDVAPREYVYGARDRMDERYDIIRMVRNKRFKYLRNYEPLKTYYQYMNTAEKGATMAEMRRLFDAGQLDRDAARFFADRKPVEELYDTDVDPHEMANLAEDPAYADVLSKMRSAHQAWVAETKDLGLIAEPLLVAWEKEIGNRFDILRQEGGDELSRRIARAAVLASSGPDGATELQASLIDENPAVRYWAAVGLGNMAPAAREYLPQLEQALRDDSPVVRIAAARAVCRYEESSAALELLAQELARAAQWERLHAAIVLDELDEQARPVIDAMHAALEPRQDFYAKGKYTVRVINRALNELEGTQRAVP